MASARQKAREEGLFGIKVMTSAEATDAGRAAARPRTFGPAPVFSGDHVQCQFVRPDRCELTPKLHQIRTGRHQPAACL
jgi:hypothetical protein